MTEIMKSTAVVEEPTLSVFLKALTEKYTGDPREAGLTLAWIPEKEQWYAAVNRYPEGGSNLSKHQRVCFSFGETLDETVRKCMRSWKIKAGLTSDDNLKKFAESVL